ncbi:MAG TPA: cupin domain-containing protein [Myxococcota bacterium]
MSELEAAVAAGESMKKLDVKVAQDPAAASIPGDAGDEAGAPDVKLGETVKRLREEGGWSIQRLAREAGVSSATIFKIEKDRMVPSVTVLLKLARALKQPIASLLENQAPKARTGYAVSRKDDRQEFRFAELPLVIERTVGGWGDRQLEAGFYIVDQGGSPTRAPLSHPGEKLYFMIDGRVRFEVDGEFILLEAGDVLHIKATLPHRWENAADGPSRMFFVVTPVPAFAKQKDAPSA